MAEEQIGSQTIVDINEFVRISSHLLISYNERDFDKVREVVAYLRQRRIATYSVRFDLVDHNWPQALEQALNDASAVAVFVGSRTGRWQRNEIGFALDRQASDERFPVIPVLLDGADASRSFLFLNTWVDLRGERLHDAEALGRLIDAAAGTGLGEPGALIDINPYRGLEYFDEDHAPFFFGRESFIEDLLNRLTAQRKKFVAVIGPSGSGKSSVVRAGLIPKLRRQRPPQSTWDVAVFTPGERPWFRLADALGSLRFPDKSDTDLDIEIDKLARALQSGELTLESVLDRILQPQGKLHRLLLVVDQFEELFTLTPKAERTPFVDRLVASLAVEGLVLVPTLRADFYGQAIEANRQLSDLLGREQVTLGRLTEKELTRAIVEPAKLARLEFDPGLPELLLRDAVNEPGILPLLQHALLRLYVRRVGNRLTHQAYKELLFSGRLPATSKTSNWLPECFPLKWASAWGEDEFGLWMALEYGGARQVFRWILPGTFMMGSPENEAERLENEAQHEVTITQGFWLADTACTQALWRAVLGENPSRFNDDPRNPVERVSWADAQHFIAALNEQITALNACLPTEAQWEYACRAGTRTPFSFGENITPEQVNYDGNYPYAGSNKGLYRERTLPVGSLPANAWGLYEMHGNVLEWCEDWYGKYGDGSKVDPRGAPEGAARVLRGGSWIYYGRNARSANRSTGEPGYRYGSIGFRLALGHGPGRQEAPAGEPRGTRGESAGAEVSRASPAGEPAGSVGE